MAERKTLTDAGIKSILAKLRPGQKVEIADKAVPGFGLRNRSFYLVACYEKGGNPTRRTLGRVGELSLEQARAKAHAWRGAIRAGKDPAVEEGRQRQAEARKRKVTFEAVAEDFIREKLPAERKGDEVARDIRRDLVSKLGNMPITEIQRLDIRDLIKAKKQRAPAQARNLLGYAKRVFSWAVDQEVYGLPSSPCTEIKAREIIGDRQVAERTLTPNELFALWRAAKRLPYPYRQVYQLLMLNALRLNEVADVSSPEFEYATRDWTIPKARMKGKNGKARPHLVPLTAESLQIIGRLPTLTKGPYIFSSDFGLKPVWIGSKIKKRLDIAMRRTLKALARKRGENPDDIKLARWTNHDIRRTVRTNLSALKNIDGYRIPEEVKEAVIAHARPGIRGVYDKYEFADEKFEALSLWADRLMEIVEPSSKPTASADVIPLRRKR